VTSLRWARSDETAGGAVGVGAGIALTAALASAGLSAWWLMPVVVVATLFASLWRATGRRA
jgi:hypothetical protein